MEGIYGLKHRCTPRLLSQDQSLDERLGVTRRREIRLAGRAGFSLRTV
jgi:hypothetical protein